MAIINTLVNANTKLIDARGPRFGAAITTVVLAVALVTHSTWLVGLQLVVFAIGAIGTPARTPYALIFKKFVRPRLRGEVPTEDVRPPQFAQAVGLAFAVVAFVAGLVGAKSVFVVALSLCLAAAFLNVAFNYCLGCEAYLLIVRLTK